MTAAGPGDPVLAVDSIDTYYGGSHVLFDASLRVDGEEAVAVVGRNGAGKTTLVRSIMGLTPPRSGSIALHGEEIAGLAPERIAGRGVGYVPQDRRLFPDLSVRENLVMGLGRAPLDPGRMSSVLDRFPALRGRLDQRAGTLSGGERQMAAIARALIGEPDLLLLDEPTEGLMPALIPEVEGIVDDLAGAGYSILLVEQRVDLALSLADRVYAMEGGRIVDEVRPGDPDADGSRLEQYLGV